MNKLQINYKILFRIQETKLLIVNHLKIYFNKLEIINNILEKTINTLVFCNKINKKAKDLHRLYYKIALIYKILMIITFKIQIKPILNLIKDKKLIFNKILLIMQLIIIYKNP